MSGSGKGRNDKRNTDWKSAPCRFRASRPARWLWEILAALQGLDMPRRRTLPWGSDPSAGADTVRSLRGVVATHSGLGYNDGTQRSFLAFRQLWASFNMSDMTRSRSASAVYHAKPAPFSPGDPSYAPVWSTRGAGRKARTGLPSKGPLIAGAIIGIVACIAALAWMIRALTYDAPLRSWTPDPVRVARFTQTLQIDKYSLLAPPEAYGILVRTRGVRHPVFRQQVETWAVDNPDGSERFQISVRVYDLKEPDPQMSDVSRSEFVANAAEEVSRIEGVSIESSSVDEGMLGNIEFAVFRFMVTNPSGAAGKNAGYLLNAVHISDLRHVHIMGMTREPPESDAFAEMEAMLLTFRDSGGE